ncbi:uncharacterized protein DNG_00048 [Cephalotrichum gorgonifer]|uniref:FAD-binding domain-containing protein n=1 Tax=Cephalotrichum gorgonifer TaxID=2041049 RepID=A0AAE8SQE3_9PEZI|nr:uncharacterized protein DNG_00048 [Cephalotrichum gorgonifer]
MTTTPQPHAVIIGAGIAGLSTAYWLGEAGWRTTVLETKPSIAPGGHIMHIFGPGRGTLKRMGVLEHIAASPFLSSDSVLRDSRGKELSRAAYADLYDDINVVATRRGDLALAIYKVLPESATVRFGAQVDTMRDHLDRVEVVLDDGEVIWGDLLIGADGQASMVRELYWEGEKWALPLGYWYAYYDADTDQGLPDYSQTYTSAGHSDVLFAPQKGCATALHIWREDHVKPPKDDELIYDLIQRVTAKSKNPTVMKVLEAAEKAGKIPVLLPAYMVSPDKWHKWRVVLVGDAAHCLSILSSQGAGMSIASAEVLGEELGKAKGDIYGGALTRWEDRVRPSIERLQARTQVAAKKLIPKHRPASKVRSLLTKMMGDDLNGAIQALGVMEEVELAELDEHKAVMAAVNELILKARAEKRKAAEKKTATETKEGTDTADRAENKVEGEAGVDKKIAPGTLGSLS